MLSDHKTNQVIEAFSMHIHVSHNLAMNRLDLRYYYQGKILDISCTF